MALLLTRDAASSTPAPMVGLSLGMYLSLYAVLLVSYVSVVFHLARKRGATAPGKIGKEIPA